MVETNFTPPLTILQRAKLLAHLSDTLHAEAVEQTLPANSMYELAKNTAKHANVLLEMIEKSRRTAYVPTEANDALLGQGRR